MSDDKWDKLMNIAAWFGILTAAILTLCWQKGKLLFLLDGGFLKYLIVGLILIAIVFIILGDMRKREGTLNKKAIWASVATFIIFAIFYGLLSL